MKELISEIVWHLCGWNKSINSLTYWFKKGTLLFLFIYKQSTKLLPLSTQISCFWFFIRYAHWVSYIWIVHMSPCPWHWKLALCFSVSCLYKDGFFKLFSHIKLFRKLGYLQKAIRPLDFLRIMWCCLNTYYAKLTQRFPWRKWN